MSKFGNRFGDNENERKKIVVPEWADPETGEPTILYVTDLLAGEFNRLQKKHKDFINNPTVEAMVDLLIMKAQDENGDKVFDLEDKPKMLRQPLALIMRVATDCISELVDFESAEKN